MKSIFLMLIVLLSCHMIVFSAAPDTEAKKITAESNVISIRNLTENVRAAEDTETAIRSLATLHLLVHTDQKYFDEDQIEQWQEYSSGCADQMKEKGIVDVLTRLRKAKQEQASVLIQKIENDECRIDWFQLLGALDKKPSDEELKLHRISELKSFGIVLPMN